MIFPQNTLDAIIDSERAMVLSASQRYGQNYDTARDSAMLMGSFLKSIDPDRWIFSCFLADAKKHVTLALFSVVRLHKVQAMMDLRQALEDGAFAAFAIANPDRGHFVDMAEFGLLNPSKKLATKASVSTVPDTQTAQFEFDDLMMNWTNGCLKSTKRCRW